MFDAVDDLIALQGAVACVEPAADDRRMVDQLEALERIKCTAAAAQARITERLDQRREGWADASVGAEVGLARHESPHRGRRLLSLARALTTDLPETLAALQRGDLNEHRALIIAEETRDLSHADRLAVDSELAGSHSLPVLGDLKLRWAVRRLVLRIDQAGALRRREKARSRRHVTGRSLPDGMAQISAVVPDLQYAAILTSLDERAATEIASGVAGDRTRSQLVADAFVARLTGQATATAVPVALHVVLSAETLLGDGDEAAEILGHGPIPASVAREMATGSPDAVASIRRLFRVEATDRLVAMDATSRAFTGALARFVRIRDQVCRTPWCNARIRHLDHVEASTAGGATAEDNGQGLCESCNYLKESPGWRHRVSSEPFAAHTVEVTTPSGTTVESHAPPPPRGQRWQRHPRHASVWTLIA